MSMHPFLHVLDILRIVFELVFEEPESGRKSMVALACTCRIFQDTAFDILWRTIPSFTPLIKCLPADAWELSVNEDTQFLSLKRPTVLSDWVRCKTYTSRVIHLGFGGGYQLTVAADAMAAMEQHEVLPLPNLRTYRCVRPLPVGPLGPELLELEIVNPGRDEASHFPRLVASLKTSSPFIQKITVPQSKKLEELSSLSSFRLPNDFRVAHLSRLGVLSIADFILPDDTLRMLASSYTIHVLKIANTSEDFLRCLPSYGPIFPELEGLSCRALHLSECSDLIRRLAPHRLQSIALESIAEAHDIEILTTEDDVSEFFQALKTHCASDVLLSISLQGFNFDNGAYSMDGFEPLLSFRNLRELDLLFNDMEYNLDNTSIERMTIAWPHMRHFSLAFEADWGTESGSEITLDGLVPMAKNWPHLEHLTLSLDGELSVDSVPLRKPGDGSCCHNVQSIDVGCSYLHSKPEVVAAFLTAIFPNLRYIAYYHDDFSDWSPVADVLEMLGEVRKQEQAHARACKVSS